MTGHVAHHDRHRAAFCIDHVVPIAAEAEDRLRRLVADGDVERVRRVRRAEHLVLQLADEAVLQVGALRSPQGVAAQVAEQLQPQPDLVHVLHG